MNININKKDTDLYESVDSIKKINLFKTYIFYVWLIWWILDWSNLNIDNWDLLNTKNDKNTHIPNNLLDKHNNIEVVNNLNNNILYVSTDNLNVRKKSSINSKVLFKLSKWEKINFIDTIINNWFIWKKIQIWDNNYFIAEKNLKNNVEYLSKTYEKNIEIEKWYSIKIDKSDRKLTVFKDWKIEKEFNMSISWIDDNKPKKIEGDMKTPEWKYFVSYKNKVSSFWTNPETWWRLGSLLVSYPNIHDAFAWLSTGIVDIKEYNKIYNSIKNKGVPPQNTNLWSWIMIHWGWSDWDWTAWCIALENSDMLWLNNNIKSWVNIEISK